MLRRLTHAVSTLSGLLLVGTLLLWARSYWRSDRVLLRYESSTRPGRAEPLVALSAWRGVLGLTDERIPADDQGYDPVQHTVVVTKGIWTFHSLEYSNASVNRLATDRVFPMGFEWRWLNSRSDQVRWPVLSVCAPMWAFSLLFLLGLAPELWSYWRRRALRRAGHCQQCGYDLTGNVSGRCPECGTEASQRAAAGV